MNQRLLQKLRTGGRIAATLAFCLVLSALALAQDNAPPSPDRAAGESQDPVAMALENYEKVTSYRVTLRSTHGGSTEIIHYFFKRPDFVRMEFAKPHKGAVLIYDPTSKRVRLWPFGLSNAIALTLSPGNRLVRSAQGHRPDKSDIGVILEKVVRLQKRGKTSPQGQEQVGGKPAILVEVVGEEGFAVETTHRYLLDLDASSMLPLRVRTYGLDGNLTEDVLMDDLETNVQFDDSFFKP